MQIRSHLSDDESPEALIFLDRHWSENAVTGIVTSFALLFIATVTTLIAMQ